MAAFLATFPVKNDLIQYELVSGRIATLFSCFQRFRIMSNVRIPV